MLAVRHQLHRKMSKRTSKESTHLLTYITSRRVRIYRSSATCIYTLSRPFLSFCFCSTLSLRESSKHRADKFSKIDDSRRIVSRTLQYGVGKNVEMEFSRFLFIAGLGCERKKECKMIFEDVPLRFLVRSRRVRSKKEEKREEC